MKVIRFWDRISAIIFLAGAIIFGAQCYLHQSFTLISGLGILITLLGIIISFVKVRCPFCGHFLGWAFTSKNCFCPQCGYNFEE
jgi:hypothetical protein